MILLYILYESILDINIPQHIVRRLQHEKAKFVFYLHTGKRDANECAQRRTLLTRVALAIIQQ